MVLIILYFAKDVEKEDTHVFVEVLMVQKQFGQEGKVFTVDRIFIAINLKHSHIILLISIDFISGRVEQRAYLGVTFEFYFQTEEREAEVADIKAIEVVVVDWVGTKVPGVSGIFA